MIDRDCAQLTVLWHPINSPQRRLSCCSTCHVFEHAFCPSIAFSNLLNHSLHLGRLKVPIFSFFETSPHLDALGSSFPSLAEHWRTSTKRMSWLARREALRDFYLHVFWDVTSIAWGQEDRYCYPFIMHSRWFPLMNLPLFPSPSLLLTSDAHPRLEALSFKSDSWVNSVELGPFPWTRFVIIF